MRILAWDVENLPNITSTWKLYDTRISHKNIIEHQSLISIAWQFVDEKTCHSVSIADDPKRFRTNIYDDYHVVKTFHEVLSAEQDFVLLAHNGDRFDIKKFNTSAIHHRLPPVTERQSIDTLKQARKHFKFDSNRLDYIGRYLEEGKKIETGGDQLWGDILQVKYPPVGTKPDLDLAIQSVKKMVKYNKQDVKLLINIFNRLRDRINIPTFTLYNREVIGCTKCGSRHFTTYGWRYTKDSKYRRFLCKTCNAPFDPPRKLIKYYEAELFL